MTTTRRLLFTGFILFTSYLFGQNQSELFEPSFKNIAIEEGLSNYHVTSICQDSLGYLWIGTGRGLNRYDGNEFKHYFFSPENSTEGLPHNYIDALSSCNNHIFVKTRRGLVSYNQKTDKWTSLSVKNNTLDFISWKNRLFVIQNRDILEYDFGKNQLKSVASLSSIKASLFVRSDDQFLWILSNDRKTLFRFDPTSSLLLLINLSELKLRRINSARIINTKLILTSLGEIYSISLSKNKDAIYEPISRLSSSKGKLFFPSIEQWDQHTALIGSGKNGINIYDTRTDLWNQINKEESLLSTQLVNTSFRDRDGNLWVGTFENGLDVHYKKQDKFNFNSPLNKITKGIFINRIVYNPYKDELLLGSRSEGLLSNKSGKNNIINNKIKQLGLTNVNALIVDSQNKLWIAGFEEDIILVYDQGTEQIIRLPKHELLSQVLSISEHEGQIYLVSRNSGVFIYSLEGELKKRIATTAKGLNQLLHIGSNKLLCSTTSGLLWYEGDAERLNQLRLYEKGKELEWDGAICMKQESDSIVWVGTMSWGLIKVNIKTLEAKMFTTLDGLPCNDITAIEIDEKGFLWLSTSNGVSCMYEEGKFNNFSSPEGLGNFQFHRRSSFKSENGTIYFGGNDGLSYFKPGDIEINKKMDAKPLLESLEVHNAEVRNNDETQLLNHTLPFTSQIALGYAYTDFSINYTSTEFLAHDQIQYAYRLKGWNNEWRNVSNQQHASYSNLPPGDYTFEVKAKRGGGNWSDTSCISIIIQAAPWKTWWAYLTYILVFAALGYLYFSLRFKNKIARKKLEIEQNEHKRESNMNEMKLRFFTNISHEIRTPLSMIYDITSANLQDLNTEDKLARFLSNIKVNVARLNRLVDQLLIFRKLEADTLQLKNEPSNLRETLESIVSTIHYTAQKRNINLFFEYDLSADQYMMDKDKVEKIIYNLLENALKYTPKEGTIMMHVSQISRNEVSNIFESPLTIIGEEDYMLFDITDSGMGISPTDISRIFERYFKASHGSDYSGIGIGLNFVKRLIDLQGGWIKVESTAGSGTTFLVALPIIEVEYSDDYQVSTNKLPQLNPEDWPVKPTIADIPEAFKKKKILIVEDDISLNNYLEKSFENHFKIYTAFDSEEALSIIKNVFPDIIISDVMMREENEGLSLCETVKNDPLLSHIPIILLSAKAEDVQVDEGLLKGADIYITKPFSTQVLMAQIISLLKNRIRLQKHLFKGELREKSLKEDFNTQDLTFIKKVNTIIEREYKNPKFNVVELSKEMLINRTGFYQKFNQITKLPPSDYLRKYRIKKSIQLLLESNAPVTVIGSEVGFSSRGGFFNAFKKERGMTPSEFRSARMQ